MRKRGSWFRALNGKTRINRECARPELKTNMNVVLLGWCMLLFTMLINQELSENSRLSLPIVCGLCKNLSNKTTNPFICVPLYLYSCYLTICLYVRRIFNYKLYSKTFKRYATFTNLQQTHDLFMRNFARSEDLFCYCIVSSVFKTMICNGKKYCWSSNFTWLNVIQWKQPFVRGMSIDVVKWSCKRDSWY